MTLSGSFALLSAYTEVKYQLLFVIGLVLKGDVENISLLRPGD